VRRPAAIVAAIAAMIACGDALCAPHLVPCRRTPGYEEAVERVMRAAWPHHLDLLMIMYLPLTEHGIGLARTEEGFDLVRLELDKSFWYSSWRDVSAGETTPDAVAVATEVYRQDGRALGAQVLDFTKTTVRVATMSVPIGEELGAALREFFGSHAADAHVEVRAATDPILLDGYKFEILQDEQSCAALESPPRDSDAYRIDRLVRLLYDRVPTWNPTGRETFEADLLAAIPD
jgi:hypothetical protein